MRENRTYGSDRQGKGKPSSDLYRLALLRGSTLCFAPYYKFVLYFTRQIKVQNFIMIVMASVKNTKRAAAVSRGAAISAAAKPLRFA